MTKFNWIVAAAFIFAGCTRGQANEAQAQTQPPPAKVEPANEPVVIQPPMEIGPKSESKPQVNPDENKTVAQAGPKPASPNATTAAPSAEAPATAEPKPASPNPTTAAPATKPEPAKPEPAKTEPAKPEPAKPAAPTPAPKSATVATQVPPAPGNADKMRSVLRTDDIPSELFASALLESDQAKAGDFTRQYASEVLDDAEMAPAKIAKTQLSIRELAEANLYDDATALRVAYIQSVLDEQAQTESDAVIVRDGLLIVVTSAIVGVVAGYSPVNKLVRSVEKGGAASSRVVSTEIAQAEIQALGMSIADVADISLTPLRKGLNSLPMDQFRPSSVPGIRWAMLNELEGQNLNDGRVLVMNWNPFNRQQGSFVSSRVLNSDEAKIVERQLDTASRSSVPAAVTRSEPVIIQEGEKTGRPFQIGRAFKYGVGSAIPFTGFYARGYFQGSDSGKQDNLFLESLVPPEKMRQVKTDAK